MSAATPPPPQPVATGAGSAAPSSGAGCGAVPLNIGTASNPQIVYGVPVQAAPIQAVPVHIIPPGSTQSQPVTATTTAPAATAAPTATASAAATAGSATVSVSDSKEVAEVVQKEKNLDGLIQRFDRLSTALINFHKELAIERLAKEERAKALAEWKADQRDKKSHQKQDESNTAQSAAASAAQIKKINGSIQMQNKLLVRY